MDDLTNQLGPRAAHAVRDFDRMARDRMTPEEFFYSDDPEGLLPPPEKTFETLLSQIQDPDARQYIETMMHSDLATEPSQTSLGYGLQIYLMNDPAYMQPTRTGCSIASVVAACTMNPRAIPVATWAFLVGCSPVTQPNR